MLKEKKKALRYMLQFLNMYPHALASVIHEHKIKQ